MRWGLEGDGMVSLKIEQIGDRPAGMNADDASVIQAAYGSLLSLGISLDKYTLAATDQNVPLCYSKLRLYFLEDRFRNTLHADQSESGKEGDLRTLEGAEFNSARDRSRVRPAFVLSI